MMIGAEDKYLRQQVGQRVPFKVPDGYFDHLADRVMAQLPVQPSAASKPDAQPARRVAPLWRRWYGMAAAAAFAGVVLAGAAAYLNRGDKGGAQADRLVARGHTAAVAAAYDSSLDIAASYTMLDNDEIYAMVSDNQYN